MTTGFYFPLNQVREQIQSGVSRQLEALRSREVWLLQQVEVVRGVKEAVLGQQAEIIQQALGSLQTYAQYQKETDGDGLLDQLCRFDINIQPFAFMAFIVVIKSFKLFMCFSLIVALVQNVDTTPCSA